MSAAPATPATQTVNPLLKRAGSSQASRHPQQPQPQQHRQPRTRDPCWSRLALRRHHLRRNPTRPSQRHHPRRPWCVQLLLRRLLPWPPHPLLLHRVPWMMHPLCGVVVPRRRPRRLTVRPALFVCWCCRSLTQCMQMHLRRVRPDRHRLRSPVRPTTFCYCYMPMLTDLSSQTHLPRRPQPQAPAQDEVARRPAATVRDEPPPPRSKPGGPPPPPPAGTLCCWLR